MLSHVLTLDEIRSLSTQEADIIESVVYNEILQNPEVQKIIRKRAEETMRRLAGSSSKKKA